MPLVGHGPLVADNSHHESKSELLGPHGSLNHQVMAPADNPELGPGMQEELGHDTDVPDFISTQCHTSENNLFLPSPRFPSGSYRSLLLHQPRRSLQHHRFVSNIFVVNCQPRPLPSCLPASLELAPRYSRTQLRQLCYCAPTIPTNQQCAVPNKTPSFPFEIASFLSLAQIGTPTNCHDELSRDKRSFHIEAFCFLSKSRAT